MERVNEQLSLGNHDLILPYLKTEPTNMDVKVGRPLRSQCLTLGLCLQTSCHIVFPPWLPSFRFQPQ